MGKQTNQTPFYAIHKIKIKAFYQTWIQKLIYGSHILCGLGILRFSSYYYLHLAFICIIIIILSVNLQSILSTKIKIIFLKSKFNPVFLTPIISSLFCDYLPSKSEFFSSVSSMISFLFSASLTDNYLDTSLCSLLWQGQTLSL